MINYTGTYNPYANFNGREEKKPKKSITSVPIHKPHLLLNRPLSFPFTLFDYSFYLFCFSFHSIFIPT